MPQTEVSIPLHVLTGVNDIAHRAGGAFAFIYGGIVILGGAERWGAPQFRTALMVPGAPESWGVTLALLGVASLIASFTLNSDRGMIATAALMGLWWTMLASAFSVEAADSEAVSWTPVVSGYAFASIYYSLVALAVIHHNWATRPIDEE